MIPEDGALEVAYRSLEQDAERQLADFLKDVLDRVEWSQFPGVRADVFKQIKLLAAMDLWFSYPEREKARRLNIHPPKDGEASCESLRRRHEDAYEQIAGALLVAFEDSQAPASLEERVKDLGVQSEVFRHLRRLMRDTDGRVAERAIQQLTDRMVAPKRQEAQQRILVLGADAVRLIQEGDRHCVDAEIVDEPLGLSDGLEEG